MKQGGPAGGGMAFRSCQTSFCCRSHSPTLFFSFLRLISHLHFFLPSFSLPEECVIARKNGVERRYEK